MREDFLCAGFPELPYIPRLNDDIVHGYGLEGALDTLLWDPSIWNPGAIMQIRDHYLTMDLSVYCRNVYISTSVSANWSEYFLLKTLAKTILALSPSR